MRRPETSPSAGYPCSVPPSRHGSDPSPPNNHRNEDELMTRLDGKVAVITGGSSGIGLASAQRFVEEGAYVFITGRRQSELDKAKALIGEGGATVARDATKSAHHNRRFASA